MEDFARYLYLPRIAGPGVLSQAIRDGVALLTWQSDTFAYAESYDESAGRYRGLRGGQMMSISADDTGLLVKPDVARRQLEVEVRPTTAHTGTGSSTGGESAGGTGATTTGGASSGGAVVDTTASRARRFHGTVQLDATRVGRDASRVRENLL